MSRMEKVNEELLKVISQILSEERVEDFVTVQEVDTAPDLKSALVWVSFLTGQPAENEQKIKNLQNQTKIIQKLMAQRTKLKFTPKLTFKLDLRPERAAKIDKILDQIQDKSPNKTPDKNNSK